jgi:hypothetical protein
MYNTNIVTSTCCILKNAIIRYKIIKTNNQDKDIDLITFIYYRVNGINYRFFMNSYYKNGLFSNNSTSSVKKEFKNISSIYMNKLKRDKQAFIDIDNYNMSWQRYKFGIVLYYKNNYSWISIIIVCILIIFFVSLTILGCFFYLNKNNKDNNLNQEEEYYDDINF